jgi:hypothetical protein
MARHRKSAVLPPLEWWNAGLRLWALNTEASAVVGLRMMKMAAGGTEAGCEASRMMTEKAQAMTDLQVKAIMTGALGSNPLLQTERTLSHYRTLVRANHRRLSRS